MARRRVLFLDALTSHSFPSLILLSVRHGSTKGLVFPRFPTNVTTFIISSHAQVSTAISRKSNVRHYLRATPNDIRSY